MKRVSHNSARKPLDEMIDEASKLEPGPEAWRPIFDAYPELSVEELAKRFRLAALREFAEAEALERYYRARPMT